MATTSKEWSKTRQFVRTNSPSEGAQKRLDGNGHARGTRRPADYQPVGSLLEQLVIRQLIRLAPSWTTTTGSTEGDAEQEMFGQLRRSFQTWTDAPPLQWHRWYDWNFHLEAEAGYQWLRGLGNTDGFKKPDPAAFARGEADAAFEAVVKGNCAELEWDTGAFGQRPGPMFNQGGGATVDWAWPMTDDFFWARGRSIYDGGHEHEPEDPDGPEHKDSGNETKSQPGVDKVELTRSELHPCKAVASARWEAHRFDGQPHFLPANQFMFFSSRLGGYKDFDSLKASAGGNYEFIVDIPEPSGAFTPMTLSVGATSDFPFNRIVLRQEPLIDFDFSRFLNARQVRKGFSPSVEAFAKFPPRVELLPAGADPKKRQVKVTIPMDEFVAANPEADFYGVLVSIGWPDPDGELARRVKKCTVRLDRLVKARLDHDTFKEEWRLKVGVNGRWFQFEFDDMGSGDARALGTELSFHLFDEDPIRVSAHGAELDLVDDVYGRSDGDRTVTLSERDINLAADPENRGGSTDRRPAVWERDVDVSPKKDGTFVNGSRPVQRAVASRIFDIMFTTLNDQNDPIGIIDAGHGDASERAFNPITPAGFIQRFGEGKEKGFSLKALRTEEVGDSAELVQVAPDLARPDDLDYRLEYTVRVEPQAL